MSNIAYAANPQRINATVTASLVLAKLIHQFDQVPKQEWLRSRRLLRKIAEGNVDFRRYLTLLALSGSLWRNK